MDLRCAYHRSIPDPDLKATIRIFRRDGLYVRHKVYQCLYIKSYILSIGGRNVICSLKLQTGGVLHTNCIIFPKRRIVGYAILFVVGFLRPDGRIKAIVFEFFEKAGRGQLLSRTSQLIFIFYVTNIVIEIAIRYTIILTICYSSKIGIILGSINRSYTNAMINNIYYSSTPTADSCRRTSLHVSCKKALGNLSILSGIATDSTCCIPFYRSGKGAAINFARRQISTNSSCFTITRNNVSVGSQQQYYFTAFAG